MTGTTEEQATASAEALGPSSSGQEDERTPGRWAGHSRLILVMAVAGIVLRLVLAPLTSYTNDDLPWYTMVVSGMQHLPVYARPGFSYPPIWGWILELLGRVLGALGATPATLGVHDATLNQANMLTAGALATTVTSPLFNVCVKSLLIGADLATALLLAGLAPRISDRPRAREWAFGLYFLNPLAINESSVRAGIDGLVALAVVATLAMVAQRRFVLAGAVLAFGVFVKLTPILLAPLVLSALVSVGRHERGRWRDSLGEAARLAVGAGAVSVLVVLPLLATGQWSGFLENTFSRTQTGLEIGGPAFGGLRHFAYFAGLLRLSQEHSGLVLAASLLIEILVVAAMTLWVWFKARQSVLLALIMGSTAVFAVVVATTPTSQPGYVLWFVPGLVLLASVRPRLYLPLLAMLSSAAVVFSLTYYSPAQVLFPLAEYTKWVSPRSLANTVKNWYLRGTTLWGASYKENFASICAAVAMLAYVVLVPQCVEDRRLFEATRGVREPERARQGGHVRLVAGLVVLSLLAMLVSVATAAPPPGSAGTRLVRATFADHHVRATVAVKPIADERTARMIAFPVSRPPAVRRVVVVVDSSMPYAFTSLEDERGVFDNLKADLTLKGYGGSVTMTDVSGLLGIVSNTKDASSTAVVDTSGVLPSTVFGPAADLLLPWLRAGGTLYWGGAPVGLYVARPGQSRPDTWFGGPETLIGPAATLPADPGRQAIGPTTDGQALNLQYRDASFSPSWSEAEQEGAVALGSVGPGVSSVTDFPLGTGHLVVFGGMMYENAQVAEDIAVVEDSGILGATGPLFVTDEAIGATGSRWTRTVADPTAAMEQIVVFDPRPIGISFSTFVVDVPACRPNCR